MAHPNSDYFAGNGRQFLRCPCTVYDTVLVKTAVEFWGKGRIEKQCSGLCINLGTATYCYGCFTVL